jgi:hypothetical protein
MSAIAKKLEVLGWDLLVGEDDVPRVRDLDLGERLGFSRPRDFRKLVERLRNAGILNDIDCRATVARQVVPASGGLREVVEYHLSERGALKAIVKSETPKAVEITGQVIDVYLAVRSAQARPATIPLDVAHGPRIGETELERRELVSWCTLVAASLGVSVHRVHGAIRRTYRVPSAYAVTVLAWPLVRSFLEALGQRRILLPGRARPVLRLVQDTRQLGLPGVQR